MKLLLTILNAQQAMKTYKITNGSQGYWRMPAKEYSKHENMSKVLISHSTCNPLIIKAIFKICDGRTKNLQLHTLHKQRTPNSSCINSIFNENWTNVWHMTMSNRTLDKFLSNNKLYKIVSTSSRHFY